MVDSTYEKIAGLLREVDEKHATATPESLHGQHLSRDLGLDSLDVIKFILLVEERFGVKLADEDIDGKQLLEVDNLARHLNEA